MNDLPISGVVDAETIKRWRMEAVDKIEYVGTTTLEKYHTFLFREIRKEYVTLAVYKRYSPMTNIIFEVYAHHEGEKINFNIDAFKHGQIVKL